MDKNIIIMAFVGTVLMALSLFSSLYFNFKMHAENIAGTSKLLLKSCTLEADELAEFDWAL